MSLAQSLIVMRTGLKSSQVQLHTTYVIPTLTPIVLGENRRKHTLSDCDQILKCYV